jgi:hypothetical protein
LELAENYSLEVVKEEVNGEDHEKQVTIETFEMI